MRDVDRYYVITLPVRLLIKKKKKLKRENLNLNNLLNKIIKQLF